jgi:predicted DNA-binding transcriptional regulator AlpA
MDVKSTSKQAEPAAQVANAKKAAALKQAAAERAMLAREAPLSLNKQYREQQALLPDGGSARHDRERLHAPRAPPPPAKEVTAARELTGLQALLSRHEVVALSGFSYPTLWKHIRAGLFPRGRRCFGKTMWLRSEIEAWIAGLPPQQLKGDQPSEFAQKRTAAPARAAVSVFNNLAANEKGQ